MSEKITVVHHSADYDGLFCREIARKFLPEAELVGWDYKDPKIPFPSEGFVYVLDLSPDCFQFMDGNSIPDYCTAGTPKRLIWIDHHKSAIEKFGSTGLHDQIAGYRIDGVAACRLAWQWFQRTRIDDIPQNRVTFSLPDKQAFIDRKVSEPMAVRLAGEYDIWDKRDPDAELFQHGLRSMELTDAVWAGLLASDEGSQTAWVGKLLMNGVALQYAKTQENESIIKAMGFTIQFEGLTFLACNHARYNSHLFTAGLTPEHDACFGFKWGGKQWEVSLYHAPGKEHHDLSQIAVKYGGGGHRGACGFRVAKLPFLP